MIESGIYFFDNKVGENVCNITNWQAVTALNEDRNLLITVFFRVYKLLDSEISFEDFYNICQDNRYKPCYLPCKIIGVALPCPKCNGNGQLDWIELVMKSTRSLLEKYERNPYEGYFKFVVPAKDNPHIPPIDSILDLLLEGPTQDNLYVYTSIPNLKYNRSCCNKCYGSGLRELTRSNVSLVSKIKELN